MFGRKKIRAKKRKFGKKCCRKNKIGQVGRQAGRGDLQGAYSPQLIAENREVWKYITRNGGKLGMLKTFDNTSPGAVEPEGKVTIFSFLLWKYISPLLNNMPRGKSWIFMFCTQKLCVYFQVPGHKIPQASRNIINFCKSSDSVSCFKEDRLRAFLPGIFTSVFCDHFVSFSFKCLWWCLLWQIFMNVFKKGFWTCVSWYINKNMSKKLFKSLFYDTYIQ